MTKGVYETDFIENILTEVQDSVEGNIVKHCYPSRKRHLWLVCQCHSPLYAKKAPLPMKEAFLGMQSQLVLILTKPCFHSVCDVMC